MVLQALGHCKRMHFPAWQDNLRGADRNLIRWAGGIPVPTELHAIKPFNDTFEDLHKRGKWIHVFPESANWHYYQPIRPFKKGMFTMAWQLDMPVLPMAFSWRPRTGLWKLFGKKPLVTLRIGEPILPDKTLKRRESVDKLRKETHEAVVRLAGINPADNPWPAEGD
jgi:1-acyl-sn-glycerol-3-phosphate acyltransferase